MCDYCGYCDHDNCSACDDRCKADWSPHFGSSQHIVDRLITIGWCALATLLLIAAFTLGELIAK
jgi:predicted lipoprotein with Yx(FWY)xxD motif